MSDHITDEQLILHYYGEGDGAVDEHLAGCSGCRSQYRRLQLALNSVQDPLPDRPADYEERVWAKVEPKVSRGNWRRWLAWRRWAPVAAVAALLVAAFLAGRYTPQPQVASNGPQVRERVLLVAVGQHLERSQMVLAELVNLESKDRADIAPERAVARNLADENRLYRQTAQAAGDTRITAVLDDLERVLVEIANSPEEPTPAQLDVLRQRIESEGLLFKVRVVRSRLREQAAPLKTGTTNL